MAISRERSEVAPLGARRFGIRFTVDERTEHKLRYAEELFSHRIRPGDLARLFDRALDALIREGEKRKFGATGRPRQSHQRSTRSVRHVRAEVRRAVWERDQGRCTFVSESGRRCASRHALEFDHVTPVAHGGDATIANLRLRCQAHNQHEAERVFGADFMRHKRAERRQRAAEEQARKKAEEIVPGLRNLGFTAEQARHAAVHCAGMPEASLEERFRAALRYLRPAAPSRGRETGRPAAGGP